MKTGLINTIVLIIGLSVASVAMSQTAPTALSARVDRDKISMGETLTLLIEYSGTQQISAPDVSVLNADFDVLGTSQQQNVSIINGQRTSSIIWASTLAPRQTGAVVIPAISVNQWKTNPIKIEVLENSPVANAAGSQGLSVEASIEDKVHYVQGELLYTLRMQLPIGTTELNIEEPSLEDMQFTQHGEDKNYSMDVGGQAVQVYERNYLVRPQRSGSFEIPPVSVQIRVRADQSRSPFGNSAFPNMFGQSRFNSPLFDQLMNPGRAVTIRSNSLAIDVQPRPQASNGWFLPAERVQISETWLPENPQFRVGEAVTRKIQLMAFGASAEQLPDITLKEVAGIRIYREGSTDRTVPTPSGMASVREYTVTIMPTQDGEIILPSIEFNWWDVKDESEKIASIASRQITVLPVLAGSNVASGLAVKPNASLAAAASTARSSTDELNSQANSNEHPFFTVTTVMLTSLVLSMGMLVGWWLRRQYYARTLTDGSTRRDSANKKKSVEKQRLHDIQESVQAIRTACEANNNKAAFAALNRWCRARYPGIEGDAVAFFRLTPQGLPMSAEIDALVSDTFGEQQRAWSGSGFYEAFRKAQSVGSRADVTSSADQILPALYPANLSKSL